MDASTGGELACHLSQLDDQGNMPDARWSIMPRSDGTPPGTRCVHIPEPGDQGAQLAVLAPLPDESLEDYGTRLEGPVCRTMAWHIALVSEQSPVSVEVAGHSADDPFVLALLAYLRSLLE